LIKLPAAERAELAITLWDSLSDAERDAEFALTPELDRRWAAHLDDPSSAIPWDNVRRLLRIAVGAGVSYDTPFRRGGQSSGR
jgi:putative addiction module component (TIGR02574 family)